MIGMVYSLVALGFVVIYKASGILNFAQGELLVLGAFVCWSTIAQLHLPVWVSLLVVFVYCIVLGFIIERSILRHMIGQSLVAIMMMTIGLSQIIRGIIILIWGATVQYYPKGFIPAEVWKIGAVSLPAQQVWSFAVAALLVVGLIVVFQYTRIGVVMRAASEDQLAAQASGVKVGNVFAYSWVIATLVAAAGGILLGSMTEVSLDLGFLGLAVFPVVVGGGLDSIIGAVICGPLVGILESVAVVYIDEIVGSGTKAIIPYVFLFLFLMFRPHGIFGQKQIERV